MISCQLVQRWNVRSKFSVRQIGSISQTCFFVPLLESTTNGIRNEKNITVHQRTCFLTKIKLTREEPKLILLFPQKNVLNIFNSHDVRYNLTSNFKSYHVQTYAVYMINSIKPITLFTFIKIFAILAFVMDHFICVHCFATVVTPNSYYC